MSSTLADLRSSFTRNAFATLNRVVAPAVKAGLGSPLPVGVGVVVLETVGRVSGEPRQVPLVATRLGDRICVTTVRGSSQWAKNLRAEPRASVWVGGTKRPASSEVTLGALTRASLTLDD